MGAECNFDFNELSVFPQKLKLNNFIAAFAVTSLLLTLHSASYLTAFILIFVSVSVVAIKKHCRSLYLKLLLIILFNNLNQIQPIFLLYWKKNTTLETLRGGATTTNTAAGALPYSNKHSL